MRKREDIIAVIGLIVAGSAIGFLLGFYVIYPVGVETGRDLGHYEVLQKKVIYELQQQPDSTVIWVRMK